MNDLQAVVGPTLDFDVALSLGLGLLAGGFMFYVLLRTDPQNRPAESADFLVGGSLLGSLVGAMASGASLAQGATTGDLSVQFEQASLGAFGGAILGVGAASLTWDYFPRLVNVLLLVRGVAILAMCALGVALAVASPPAAVVWLITEPLSVAAFLACLRVTQVIELMRGA